MRNSRPSLRGGGMKVSAHRIKNTVKMRRDADGEAAFLRSSICFPEKQIKATVPELINLLEEVLKYGWEDDTGCSVFRTF